MKKILFLAVSIILLFILVSCNTNGTHTHAFGEWNVVKEASCTEDGKRERTCDCGEVEEKIISASGHTEETIDGTPATCTEDGISDGKKCTACGEIIANQESISSLGHDYKCTTEADENGNPITISACQRKNCESVYQEYVSGLYDADNNLLASWDELVDEYGLDIETYYNSGDFKNKVTHFTYITQNNVELKSAKKLIVDNSVTKISAYAFEQCTSLEYIYLPASIELVNFNFDMLIGCYSIKNIEVAKDSLHFKTIDGNLYTKDGEVFVKYATGKEDKEFTLPEDVKEICNGAFSCSSHLETIYLHNSITNIYGRPFSNSLSINDIYYSGSEAEWEALNIHMANYPNDAVFHYNGIDRFMTFRFAGDFGSSGATGVVHFKKDNGKTYISNNALGDWVLYTEISYVNSLKIEYSESVYQYIEMEDEQKGVKILEKIQSCGEWYVLKGIDDGCTETRIVCYLDGVLYCLVVFETNEETGVNTVIRITSASIGLED